MALLEEVGAQEVNAYLHLVEFNMFAVQARYEAGLLDDEQALDRPTITSEVQTLLLTVENLAMSG